MGILLHPFVSIPLSITIDFITDCLKKCYNFLCKDKCKTEKKCGYVSTMPLYLALVCACQYYLISTWDFIQRERLENSNLTMRGAFDNYLDFDQCCAIKPCRLSDTVPEDIGKLVSDVFSRISTLVDKSSDMLNANSYLRYILIAVIILLIFYVIIENCTSKPIPISTFIIGPSTSNHEGQESEQQFEMSTFVQTTQQKSDDDDASHEQESFIQKDPRTRPSKNKTKKKLLIIQIVCCFLTIVYILAVYSSTYSFKNAFTNKLLECDNGLYDSNPGKPINCQRKFLHLILIIQ